MTALLLPLVLTYLTFTSPLTRGQSSSGNSSGADYQYPVTNTSDVTKSTTTEKSLGDKISSEISKNVQTVKQPIEEALVYIGTAACSKVKKIVGVAYDQLDGIKDKEPDLNTLALQFISREVRVIYNLSTAAQIIPEARRRYSPENKLFIFVHGFTDNPGKSSFSNISDALMSQGEYNVLALDASVLLKWFYLRATTYVQFIGEKLGEVLAAMVQNGVDPASIHLIGHSLGAHITGHAAKTFKELTGIPCGRVSGLDPAGPCFSNLSPELRLNASDAEFVDIIHSDAGVYGLRDPMGDVDYYPNNGAEQPGCVSQSCSHSRAWQYYAESIVNPEAFPAKKCKDWAAFKKNKCDNNDINYMGYGSTNANKGLYFLQTGEDSPYGLGPKGLTWKNNEGIIKSVFTQLG